ncbi:ribosomal protein S18-alanine N-acetyltransferase (plasmid) [Candidatus Vallotia cooleyia]|nr:ribosomal protein S18-alanine N-acetyltransferase [Candidatus Vallotia cooleyia]
MRDKRYLMPMIASDLDEVEAVERVVYTFPWTRESFEDSLNNGHFGICLRNDADALVGYCMMMLVVDEMHLLNLCVTPDAQGKGVGVTLMHEVVQIARTHHINSILLDVRLSNHHAIRLYKRFNFVVIGRRKNYYSLLNRAREDAIVMRYSMSYSVSVLQFSAMKHSDEYGRCVSKKTFLLRDAALDSMREHPERNRTKARAYGKS